jgi:hypothetical protein
MPDHRHEQQQQQQQRLREWQCQQCHWRLHQSGKGGSPAGCWVPAERPEPG